MTELIESTPEDWRASLKGEPGLSTYEIALESGFVGTEKEWLDSLKLTYADLTEEDKEDLQGPSIWRD
mgnify:CR=1 FL=1